VNVKQQEKSYQLKRGSLVFVGQALLSPDLPATTGNLWRPESLTYLVNIAPD
jgi:hypothetical protein